MSPDEIYLASFPFGGSAGMKLRPVLLLTGTVGSVPEVLVAYISSVIPPSLLTSDMVLDPNLAAYASTTVRIRGRWSRTDGERARGPRRGTGLQLDHNNP